ncbi:DUF2442 domain-containing protein [Selenomonas sp. AE3005]|uniref:DUF2442 domain-containing protein n=1 Tax=Selenomonas sp. AE3005 TaxID=1485543 RepID=UPI000486ACFD|nr:DUF2442 domain-containing protein [Selenomonas sp. AE3005]
MIPRITKIEPRENYILYVIFDDGKKVLYDVKDDIHTLPTYRNLMTEPGLFQNFQIDESRTCVFWNDEIDLASDIIYEYGLSC